MVARITLVQELHDGGLPLVALIRALSQHLISGVVLPGLTLIGGYSFGVLRVTLRVCLRTDTPFSYTFGGDVGATRG